MRNRPLSSHLQRWSRPLLWALPFTALTLVQPSSLAHRPIQTATLLLATLVCALLATPRSRARTLRLGPTFVLTALLTGSGSTAGLIAIPALALAGSPGLAGSHRASGPAAAGAALAVVLAGFALPEAALSSSPIGLLWALAAYAMMQGAAVLGTALLPGSLSSGLRTEVPRGHALTLDLVNIPLAWVLAEQIASGLWIHVAVSTSVIVGGQAVLARLASAQRQLRHAHRDLARRIDELDTLHAISREILSTLETDRLFAIIDRDCAKIFHHDACLIALTAPDGASLRTVYGPRRPSAESELPPIAPAIADWILERKQGLRLDRGQVPGHRPTLGALALSPRLRSAMAVPLIAKGRVIGLLSVQSRKEQFYDEHQLSVLVTVAQQVAVAIENARHHEMATIDSLTGFFLRDYFFRRLDEEYRRARRYGGQFAVLMVDLDEFKAINDRFGHPAGDEYLTQAGATIRSQLRAADLACRYGGDEFCLLLPETDLAGARSIAERIREAVSRLTVPHEGNELRSTTSIGIAAFPDHDRGDVSGLMRDADQALYRAKRAGRDRVEPYAA